MAREQGFPLLGHTPRAFLVNDWTCMRHLCPLPCSRRRYAGDSAGGSFPPNPLRETGTRSFRTASVSFLRVSERPQQKTGLTLCTVARPTSGESGGSSNCVCMWGGSGLSFFMGCRKAWQELRASFRDFDSRGRENHSCLSTGKKCREAARERVNI